MAPLVSVQSPADARMIGWLATAVCSFLAVAGLASEFVREGEYAQVDGLMADWVRQGASPDATRFFQAVTDLHATIPICIAVALIAVPSLYRRAWGAVGLLLAVVPCGMLLNTAVKHLLQRARPPLSSIPTADSYSFPSGHTAGAALLYGFLLAMAFTHIRSFAGRAAVMALGSAAILAVAASRIYLQVHYASDVAAALLMALGWLSVCLAAREFIARRTRGEAF